MILIAAAAPVSITGQLLAYQDGFVFFTSGDGFRAAPKIAILDDRTKKTSTQPPRARDYARAVFDDAGQIVELDLSSKPFPMEPLPDVVQKYVVVASTPYPNPELGQPATRTRNGVTQTFSGKPVLVKITVQVPPTTPAAAQIFIATDQDSWNPQAIRLDRIDALHFSVTRRIASGTILHYVYTRGSLSTEERGENGLERPPHELIVTDADVRAVNDVVYNWADQTSGSGLTVQPGVIPTPYNPVPFPNLPSGVPTPHPMR
ncbi:MAG TPA: hypothetical protein VNF68_08420 [Candidatus Baltobacteraceae bacterium]|nr:hypothetical protein [Candidatus Baltobacteraceae bacterium]